MCGEGRTPCPLSQHPLAHLHPEKPSSLRLGAGACEVGVQRGRAPGCGPATGGGTSKLPGRGDGQMAGAVPGGEQGGAGTLPAAALPATTGVLVAESQLLLTLPPRCSGADSPHPLGPASGSPEGLDPVIPWSWSGRRCRAWSQVQGISPTPLSLTAAVSSPVKWHYLHLVTGGWPCCVGNPGGGGASGGCWWWACLGQEEESSLPTYKELACGG